MKKKPEDWITVNGVHIPVYEGESKKQAVDKAMPEGNKLQVSTKTYRTSKLDKVNALNKTKTEITVKSIPNKTSTDTPTTNTPSESESVTSQMQKLQMGGNVDLFKRPQVPASTLKQYGWKDAGEGTATVFSSTYTNEDGSKAGNFTPIQADKDGKVAAILTESELTEYAEAVLAGEIDDYLGLQIGAVSEGENALEDAEELAELIHELQEEYYLKNKKQ